MTIWADPRHPLTMDQILVNVALYWFTDTMTSSIWSYRERLGEDSEEYSQELGDVKKPYGYSRFPYDVCGAPKSWCEATGKISFYRAHDKGGHFAAYEQPDLLWQDLVEFVEHVKSYD